MIRLDGFRLAKFDLRTRVDGFKLTERRGSTPPTPPISPLQAILAKMDTEMPGLRDSLVCWYHPKLQLAEDGMTPEEFNEYLAETWPTCVGGLRDLSGNGYAMDLFGFDGFGGGYLTDDYYLQADGVDDSAVTATISKEMLQGPQGWRQSELTAIGDAKTGNKRNYCISFSNASSDNYLRLSAENRINGFFALTINRQIERAYWGDITPIGQGVANYSEAKVGRDLYMSPYNLRKDYAALTDLSIKVYIHFNKVLTNPEVEWVKDNIINF